MRSLLIVAFALVLTACETVSTTQPGVVGIERQQRFFVSSDEVNQAAASEYSKVIAAAR